MEQLREIFDEFYKKKSLIKVIKKDGKHIFGIIKEVPTEINFILVNDKDTTKLAIILFSDVEYVKEMEGKVNDAGAQ